MVVLKGGDMFTFRQGNDLRNIQQNDHRNHLLLIVVLALPMLLFTGCSSIFREKEIKDTTFADTVSSSLSEEEAQGALATGTQNWFYGQGLGDTTTKVVSSVIFPPLAIYFLGNTALNLAGYEGVYVTDAFPEPYKSGTVGIYESVTSVPGRVTSTIAGSEYKSRQVIASNGGFWGLHGKADSGFAQYKDIDEDAVQVASNNQSMRNDLYGKDRSGS